MKAKHPFPLVLLLILSTLLSCEKNSDPFIPADSFYFNSFEHAADTAGWYGITASNIVEDAPGVGGTNSVEISGGCVIPHAYYRFPPLTEDCELVLRCWGKNLSNGGSMSLYTINHSNSIHIFISESSWTKYQSEDILHCSKGDTLILDLISGGILASAMLIDQIEIKELE